MFSESKFRVFLRSAVLILAIGATSAQAAIVDLVKNGSLSGAVSNGVATSGNSLPIEWLAGTSSAAQPNTPDTLDSGNNVGVSGATNFAASPSVSPNGGTWVGIGRDADTLSENFFQAISGFTVGQQYTLSWYDANFGISSTLDPEIYQPYTGENSFTATLSSLTNTTSFTGSSRALGTGWVQHSFIFTPQNTTYTLSFSLKNATKSYLSIDGISLTTDVTAVPEPQTLAFLIAGMLIIGFTARKRNLARYY